MLDHALDTTCACDNARTLQNENEYMSIIGSFCQTQGMGVSDGCRAAVEAGRVIGPNP